MSEDPDLVSGGAGFQTRLARAMDPLLFSSHSTITHKVFSFLLAGSLLRLRK